MTKKMSRFGVGPVFVVLSLGYFAATFMLTRLYPSTFLIQAIPYQVLVALAVILMAFGIPFFILSLITVMRAYKADKLVTTGVFGCCRHPVYGSWVAFNAPGLVLLAKSWLCLTTPVFMYFVARLLVCREETYLEGVFGEAYRAYKKQVPCLLPFGMMLPKK